MSAIEYKSLIIEIRERLDELKVGKKLIFMCRGKVAPRSEENMQDASSLIAELEDKKFLAPDKLDLLKDLLKGVKEWALLEEVEKIESKRKEYDILLNQIIRALDELNDLERLVSICGRKIPPERQGNIRDVRSLFEEMENNNCLGIDRLDILKEILAKTEKSDLLMAVKEFDKRRTREDKFERRKALAATIVSAARDNFTGEDPFGKEEKRLKYIDQEKCDYIPDNLEQAREQTKDVDPHSLTTDTSDSGMLGSNRASSEVGTEDISDSVSKLCLKDITEEVTKELTSILKCDQDILDRFYRCFGLDPIKLCTKELVDIKDVFPDTPVKMLKDVFEALQLYDLAELLEKATKPRTLRPALSLKDIEKLPSAKNRPTKIFTKAEVLIIDCSNRYDAGYNPQNFGSFFKALNSKSQVVEVTAKAAMNLRQDLEKLRESNVKKTEELFSEVQIREAMLERCLEEKIPVGWFHWRSINETPFLKRNEHLLSMFQEQETAITKELEKLVAEKELLSKDIHTTTEAIKNKLEELDAEHENVKSTVSTHLNKWIEQAHDKGNESTLFVVLIASSFDFKYFHDLDIRDRVEKIERCLKEKLPLIPHTKFVIIDDSSRDINLGAIPSETLQVYFPARIGLGAMVELLNKRYKSLDLITAMLELKRTYLKTCYEKHLGGFIVRYPSYDEFDVRENLSCLPRLQKVEQM